MNKKDKYNRLLKSCIALIGDEKDLIANLSNIIALLKEDLSYFWIGFYIVKDEELVLGPFQGPIACTRIKYGKGVCGTAWKNKEAIFVPVVEDFAGHIACSSLSKSEIVIPIYKDNKIAMVLDIDSDKLNDLDNNDMKGLSDICNFIETII